MSGTAGEDVLIAQTGANDSSVTISAEGTSEAEGSAAIQLTASAGGINLLANSASAKGIEKISDVDTEGTAYYSYVSQFKWWVGLAVRDELAIGRICNIEPTGASNIFNEDKLIELLNDGHFDGPGTRIYYNPTIATQAQIRLKDKSNVNWSVGEGLSGRPITMFSGVPCRKMDKNIILNTETVLTS